MSNKWFSVFVTGLASTSLVACGEAAKKETTKETEVVKKDETETTTTVVKGNVNRGTFKLGSVGDGFETADSFGATLNNVVGKFTQDLKVTGTTGSEYFNLPAGVDLKSYKSGTWAKAGFRVGTDHAALNTDQLKKDAFVNMYKKKLDALFVAVKDGLHNSSDVYKSVVEKKEFADTNLVMVGEKAKSQSGSSSKVFAGGKVSTGTYNKYAAAYAAGFQAAVSSLSYSTEEKTFEETNASFFIGAMNDSTAKKKAFAFRRGVEAAAAHSDYAAFLKVKFVSKTADSKTTGKKLYYDQSEWLDENKIAEFTGSDDFTDSDYRVVYIAGATAENWRGKVAADQASTGLGTNYVQKFKTGDKFGLIDGIVKQADDTLSGTAISSNATKGNKTAIVLDEILDDLKSGDWTTANETGLGDTYNADSTEAISGRQHLPGQWVDADGSADGNLDSGELRSYIERNGFTLLGSIGDEKAGTEAYTQAAIKGLFLGGSTYMLGKHTIFGAGLNVFNQNPFSRSDLSEYSLTDDDTKAKEHFDIALDHVFSKELSESALIASSPWMK